MDYKDEGRKSLKQKAKEFGDKKRIRDSENIFRKFFESIKIILLIAVIISGVVLFCLSLLPDMHPVVRIIGGVCGIPIVWVLNKFVTK